MTKMMMWSRRRFHCEYIEVVVNICAGNPLESSLTHLIGLNFLMSHSRKLPSLQAVASC